MFSRSERLKELLRTEIIQALAHVKDPGLSGFLTVTDLELARDMKTAIVYYSILGTEKNRKDSAEALKRASAFIRYWLKKRLSLRSIPSIVFAYDDTPRKASRVERILLKIERETNSNES